MQAAYVLNIHLDRFFMSIGSVIRTDAEPSAVQAFANARRQPFIIPRKFPRRTDDSHETND